MAGPLIATKLHVPGVRRGLVERPALLARLDRGADARLTLVSAPPGFGKTTLLAEWVHTSSAADRSVAWLSLDSSDDEPWTFWAHVAAALRTALPGFGVAALGLVTSSPVPTDLVVTGLLNELAGAPGEIWLVLDDYHLVGGHEVGAGMSLLLGHLPSHVHVVLSTRADPDLPLARWRVRGELVEVRAADLRFTAEETIAFLDRATGRQLAPRDVEVLQERTEGWIAALQLAALSLRARTERGEEDVSGFITRFAGTDRSVVDYLVEEVLAQQPQHVREFLLHTAVLERLTGPLCDAVTGLGGGSEALVALERANLFLVALDDRREWYRYHHLFGEVLRARLLGEQPEQVAVLHGRASRWLEHHDMAYEAIGHALSAHDTAHAADLMEIAATAVRRDRREAVFLGWMDTLPVDVVRGSPVLSAFAGYARMVAGDLAGFEARLDDAERALDSVPDGQPAPWADTEELRTLPATIAVYRASLAQVRGDVAGTVRHARRALDLAGPDDHLARGSAAGLLGLAAWAAGDVSGALVTFTGAVASLHAAGTFVDELSGTVVLADMCLAAGRPVRARRLLERALVQAGAHGDAVVGVTAELQVVLGELDLEAGDVEGAGRRLATAEALGGPGSGTSSRWSAARGRVASAEGGLQEAVTLLDRAEQLYRPGVLPDVRPVAAVRARVWIAHGRLSEAADWARDRGVAVTDDVAHLREFDHLTLVRLLIAQYRAHPGDGALRGATGLLDRLHAAAEVSARGGGLVEVRLLQALAHQALGRRSQAVQVLVRALIEVPEPDGYARVFLDEGAPMTSLLGDAARAGLGGDHPRRLLALAAGPRPTPSSTGTLSDRELQVLRLLDGELSGPEIARALFVSHNTLRTHTRHIFTKLDVTTRRAAVRRGREQGLV